MLTPLTDRFFSIEDNSGKLTMEYVYNEVYATIKSQLGTISQDTSTKIKAYSTHFEKVKDEGDREFLQTFSMICMLGFDVFLKKQIIQSLIASIAPEEPEAKKEPPKKDGKKETKSEKNE